jgi:SAM-dependent methyltransferase
MMGAHRPRLRGSVEEDQKRRYDESYFALYRDDPDLREMYRAERERIEQLKSSGRILDVGCGLGGFLAQFPPGQWERYGVDVAEIAIREARSRGILVKDFEHAYDYPDEYFEVVVLRGSLQLIPTPFAVLQECVRLLSPGGVLALLATPNSNSPYYKRFGTLPVLTPRGNFLIPSDIMMRDTLGNLGLEIVRIHYPYLDTPYARPFRDHLYYILSFLGLRRRFAFWRSAMEVYARKPLAPVR